MEEDKQDIEPAIQYAKRYLENLLSFFGLNTDVYATKEEDVIALNVPSTHMNGFLIGQRGDTMRALQFMTSNTLKNNGYQYSRVNVDIASYKKQRADRLGETAGDWVKRVKDTGEPMHLKPMNAADRRTIHKLASENDLITESEGEGYDRHVVLKPAPTAEATPKTAKKTTDKEPKPKKVDPEPQNQTDTEASTE